MGAIGHEPGLTAKAATLDGEGNKALPRTPGGRLMWDVYEFS